MSIFVSFPYACDGNASPNLQSVFLRYIFSLRLQRNVVLLIFVVHIHTFLHVVCDVCRNLCHPHLLVNCAFAFKPHHVVVLWVFIVCKDYLNKWCKGSVCTTPNHVGLGYGKPGCWGLRTTLRVGRIQIYIHILTCNEYVVCNSLFSEECQWFQVLQPHLSCHVETHIATIVWKGTIQNRPIMFLASPADCC